MNQIFASGGGDGGMSPGSSWKPFRISSGQYDRLVQQVRETPVILIKDKARFGQLKFIIDSSFDQYKEQSTWLNKVCERYRENYHREIQKCCREIQEISHRNTKKFIEKYKKIIEIC